MSVVNDVKEAHKIAQEDSDPGHKTDRSTVSRSKQPDDSKMENELEMAKDNKRQTDTANDVAGREQKGSVTGLLQKLTPSSDTKDIKVTKTVGNN